MALPRNILLPLITTNLILSTILCSRRAGNMRVIRIIHDYGSAQPGIKPITSFQREAYSNNYITTDIVVVVVVATDFVAAATDTVATVTSVLLLIDLMTIKKILSERRIQLGY